MITKKHFTEAIAILEDRFNREHSGPTLAAYFDVIRAELTVDEFQRACRECFRRDTFFPAPQRLIDLARGGSEEDLAERAWHEVVRVLSGTERLDWAAMDEPLKAALRVSSPGAIKAATPVELHRLRQDFVRTYVAALNDAPSAGVPTIEPPAAVAALASEVIARRE